ncbi:tubulin-specific chaperone E isoform X2 [Scophthalmus maximus]|uniref:tubulin-specific chaperone E isoform X2 n=1 Tax=Scophthalmus maximus TaxID=52904 RepID=UPI001FA831FA|nr:tubulin-specific chaperone E isoform X2 [Scophthalmus maximus]
MRVDNTEPEGPEGPGGAVGRRVRCGEERATVRYVGPVPPTAGPWLGVEWDDPDRGKHDGSHEGVQYFTCRHATGGSFVRPAKASFGEDFLSALRKQYHVDTDEVQSEDGPIPLEWRGLRERSFESLQSVLLDGREVNGPGAEGEIRRTTPNVQLLDLSKTLLSCWDDVGTITQQLDRLRELRLSSNRLRLPSDPSRLCGTFSSLKTLSLISCELTWPQILQCAPMWPQLEDLCVKGNSITELQRPDGVLQNLRTLDLSGNVLLQDTVLLSLSALLRLEHLDLSDTGLSVIRFDDAAHGSPTAMFPALKDLMLDYNNITEWFVVDELDKLPSLVKLSCRGNRLTSSDGNRKTADQILIAKLGRLVILNGCTIHPKERRGAELDYMKIFGGEWLKSGGRSQTSTEFAHQHPRFQSLVDKYGAPEEGELKKQRSSALKSQLIKITFMFPDDGEQTPIEKKLPATMLVEKVKGLLHRLLKVPAADLRLSYTCTKPGTEYEIDSNLKTLHFYSVQDGDQVLVRWS